jgi:hypothetical protein
VSRKIRVYCAGPIRRGDLCENIRHADEAFYRLAKTGMFAPMVPHWTCYAGSAALRKVGDAYLSDVTAVACSDGHYRDIKGDDFIEMDLAWVRVCEAVLRLPGESVGADMEVRCAKTNGIPVFYSVEEIASWGENLLLLEEAQRASFG